MNRSTWGNANTVSFSVMALRLPRPNEIIMGHKWDDDAFVDIRKKIKQEPNIGGSSGIVQANTTRQG